MIIYSTWGHIQTLSESIIKGLEAGGAEVKLWKVPELLSPQVRESMHAKTIKLPVITSDDLPKADGFMFGIPTRYGAPAPQITQFWASTGQLWVQKALVGKYTGCFASTGTLLRLCIKKLVTF